MASSGSLSSKGIRQFRPEIDLFEGHQRATDRGPIATDLTGARTYGVGEPTLDLFEAVPEAGTPYELVASSVAVGVQSIEALQAGMRDIAEGFLFDSPAIANRRLVTLASGLRLLTTLADVASRAAGLDLAVLNAKHDGHGPLDAMGEALDQLASQQFAEDYRALAETLVTRVSPALAGWREVFADILVHADFRLRERAACS
jgi:hypothetical protein